MPGVPTKYRLGSTDHKKAISINGFHGPNSEISAITPGRKSKIGRAHV